METKKKNEGKFSQSLTFKGMIIVALILLLLIPNSMIQNLILEREERSKETIAKINEKWSLAQTLNGPVLTIPFTTTYLDTDKKMKTEKHDLHLTPEKLDISTQLYPEKRYYGIYKTILYKSEIRISGQFTALSRLAIENGVFDFDKASISLGFSDLRGVSSYPDFDLNGQKYPMEVGLANPLMRKRLIVNMAEALASGSVDTLRFDCRLNLNGSSSISFIPLGNTTQVNVEGEWMSPGFFGNFMPEYQLSEKKFKANWNVLSFNRGIPEHWIDNDIEDLRSTSFGVNLVDTVDHYQQNMRSAKYSLMFIGLTFVVFFFVEVLTRKRIHPVQYLLVGIALILFYSLLLSFSEQLGFAVAYFIASLATIVLITAYTFSIFKSKTQTGILSLILFLLYIFLYVILQLEDIALLIGSIGLFLILGIIMFVSRKINWYKQDGIESEEQSPCLEDRKTDNPS
jgi:inner membrane protein